MTDQPKLAPFALRKALRKIIDRLDGPFSSAISTGAAEPVAWIVDGPSPLDSSDVFLTHNKALEAFNDWGKRITPLYATPPVRGDRETFYTILTKYYPKDATLDNLWQEIKESGIFK